MNFKEVQELITLISKSNLTEFKMEDGDFKISIRTEKYNEGKAAPPPQIVTLPPSVNMPSPVASAQAEAKPTPPSVVVKETTETAPSQEVSTSKTLKEIKSPMVGTFYRSPGPDKPAFVKVGDTVQKGQVVCIVEAMKLFNEIESEISGKVVKILIDDTSPVEYDQPLFVIEP